jgi:hypothetical protein
MKKSLWNVLVANLTLLALALTVSCSCLCDRGKDPAVGSAPRRRPGQDPGGKGEVWRFVVSGDSRNCGDVVMPAIAAGAKQDSAQFYWHLGDLRAIYDFDDDMVQARKIAGKPPFNISQYEDAAWDDFVQNQIVPFDNMPFRLGIGNHETISPKTRCEFAKKFATWLDKPELQDGKKAPPQPAKSLKKDEKATVSSLQQCTENCQDCDYQRSRTYYRWINQGIDFIYLDNASSEQFDDDQLAWFNGIIAKDTDDKNISTVVVGMHKALPWSVSCDHSMNEPGDGPPPGNGTVSGETVYKALFKLQEKKKVYVLASHSHYYLLDIYNTRHWRNRGQVLPGWIVGTAGAQRYQLPPAADLAKARANVYGYLLGRVYADGRIDFEFTELNPGDIPVEVKNRYTERWVSESCFAGNRKTEPNPVPDYCKEDSARTQ